MLRFTLWFLAFWWITPLAILVFCLCVFFGRVPPGTLLFRWNESH